MTPDGRGGRYVDQFYQDPSGWWWPLGSQTYQVSAVWGYLITFNLLEAWIRAIAPTNSWPRLSEFGGTLEHSNKSSSCMSLS